MTHQFGSSQSKGDDMNNEAGLPQENAPLIMVRKIKEAAKPTAAVSLSGRVEWQISNAEGKVTREGKSNNLVTQIGDQLYAERGAGIASPPALPTGMKLGTGSTAASKTGAGAALVTYLTNSHQAFDTGFPASSLSGTTRRITYVSVFPPGKATSAVPVTEGVIVNETLADATSAASSTICRAILVGIGSKGSGETLTVTWIHDLVGT